MFARLKDAFTAHPTHVGESYGQHFAHAMSYSGRLLFAGFAAGVHALLPFLFEKTASTMLRQMVAEMDARAARDAEKARALQPAE